MGIIAFQFQHSSQLSIYAVMRLQPSNISYVAYSCNALCIWLFDSSTIRCNTKKKMRSLLGPIRPPPPFKVCELNGFTQIETRKEICLNENESWTKQRGNIMNLIFICCCWRWYSVLAHYQHFHFLKQFRFVFCCCLHCCRSLLLGLSHTVGEPFIFRVFVGREWLWLLSLFGREFNCNLVSIHSHATLSVCSHFLLTMDEIWLRNIEND